MNTGIKKRDDRFIIKDLNMRIINNIHIFIDKCESQGLTFIFNEDEFKSWISTKADFLVYLIKTGNPDFFTIYSECQKASCFLFDFIKTTDNFCYRTIIRKLTNERKLVFSAIVNERIFRITKAFLTYLQKLKL